MSSFNRSLLVVCGVLGMGVGVARAQFAVTDPATTAKNAAIAALKDLLLRTLSDQAAQIRNMARRLSEATSLDKYVTPDPPRWRHHYAGDDGTVLYANDYHAALNYGDSRGAAYATVARQRQAPGAELLALADSAPAAQMAIDSALATLDLADSTIIASTDQTGQLRYNGRHEVAATNALESDVIDPSSIQSATAVLSKISGAGLIRARQQQERMQFLAAIVEQLLVDNKRARDTEAAVMNMQLGRLRSGTAAGASIIAGAGDDLRSWRQP